MPGFENYDALLVDLDGTLYHPLPVKALMLLELGLCAPWVAPTLSVFRKQHEHLRRTQREPVPDPFELQLQQSAELLGKDPSVLLHLVREWMLLRPRKWLRRFARTELLRELREFRVGGGRLGLVSDYPAKEKLAAFSDAVTFDVIVASGEPGGPGRLKPHPDGYLLAAEQLGVQPKRCLVIGDRSDADGLAAERAGMAFRLVR